MTYILRGVACVHLPNNNSNNDNDEDNEKRISRNCVVNRGPYEVRLMCCELISEISRIFCDSLFLQQPRKAMCLYVHKHKIRPANISEIEEEKKERRQRLK